jgi:hypothetical protein
MAPFPPRIQHDFARQSAFRVPHSKIHQATHPARLGKQRDHSSPGPRMAQVSGLKPQACSSHRIILPTETPKHRSGYIQLYPGKSGHGKFLMMPQKPKL